MLNNILYTEVSRTVSALAITITLLLVGVL